MHPSIFKIAAKMYFIFLNYVNKSIMITIWLRVTQCILYAVHWLAVYVPARVTRGALVAHRHSFAPPIARCKTSQYRRSIVPLSVSLWNDLSDPALMVWDWRVSRAEPMLSCWHDLLFLFCLQLFYLFLSSMGWLCGVWVFGLMEYSHSLPALHGGLQLIIIITIIIIMVLKRRTQLHWVKLHRH